MKSTFYLFVLFLLCPGSYQAQSVKHASLKKEFPDENALVLKNIKVYTLSVKEEKVVVSAETTEETIALTDPGISFASSKYLHSNSFVKSKVTEAKTFSLNGSDKYKTIPATNIHEKSEVGNQVFYDDNKTTVVSYPAVSAGSITRLQSTENYMDARIFGSFYFSSYIPTIYSEVTIKAHQDIHLKYFLQNCSDTSIEFSLTKKGKYNYYTWKTTNIARYRVADAAPNLRYFIPHIIFYVENFKNKKDTVNVLSSPKDLYLWYVSMVKNLNTQDAVALKKISDSLVSGAKNEFEKVKRIFYWVQDNIKYIAFEDGLGGLVPREANAIYEKRYGDCKDMASIITKMLKLAGIKSYLTWIGTRDIPYKYTDLPTPMVDNHMIAAYKDTVGKIWLLDATGKNASIEMYTSMIQGKQALIGIDSAKCELFNVPVVAKEMNAFYDSIHVQLQNEHITGRGQLIINGYPKIYYDYLHANLTTKEFNDDLKKNLSKGNNTFSLDSAAIVLDSKRGAPTIINYTCKVNNYFKSYENETYFNFHLDKKELKYMINDTRGNIPLELDNTLSETTCVALQIPEEFMVNDIPANSSYKTMDFGYTIAYEKKGNYLIMKKYFYCNKLMILPQNFAEWTKMLVSLNKAFNESAILKHK